MTSVRLSTHALADGISVDRNPTASVFLCRRQVLLALPSSSCHRFRLWSFPASACTGLIAHPIDSFSVPINYSISAPCGSPLEPSLYLLSNLLLSYQPYAVGRSARPQLCGPASHRFRLSYSSSLNNHSCCPSCTHAITCKFLGDTKTTTSPFTSRLSCLQAVACPLPASLLQTTSTPSWLYSLVDRTRMSAAQLRSTLICSGSVCWLN